ncbi:MAG: hypothetical protein ACK46T_42335, partial [Bradyrhizobium sp.]
AAAPAAVQDKSSAKAGADQAKPEKQAHAHRHHAHEDDRPRRKHHVSKRRSSGNCKTYRTYDAESGTYRGYDGRVHSCS